MVRLADVRLWDPARLEAVFRRFGSVRDRLVDLDGRLAGCVPPESWQSPAAAAASGAHDAVAERLRRVVAGVTACRPVLAQTVDAVEVLKRDLAATESSASASGFAIDADATITDVRRIQLLPEEHAAYQAERTEQITALRSRLDAIVARADEVDSALADILTRAAAGQIDDGAATSLADAADFAIGSAAVPGMPPDGAPPAAYRDWWANLTDVQREAMLLRYPWMIGNQDGIPAGARDEANRAQIAETRTRLDDDLAAAKARVDHLQKELPHMGPEGPEDSPALAGAKERVTDLQDRRDATAAIERTLDAPGRQLVVFDIGRPGEHAPHAAVAVGDLDTARHVAVFTPGLTTTVAGSLEGYTNDMRGVRDVAVNALSRQGPEQGVATVAWLGYDAPQIDETIFDPGRSVVSASPAETGGMALARFYDGIAASRADDPAHVTALGHSYGSTTTGYALQHTTAPVDRAVFFGSPGLGTDDLGELNVKDGRVGVLEARWDPVADLARFGTDPNQLDDVTNLSSAETTLPDGRQLAESTGHSDYLAPGTTSQYNIGVAVAGLDDRGVTGSNSGLGDELW